MSWNYSGDPASSNLDAVRFLIGDTVSTDQQVSDEEITWLLSTSSSDVSQAAILAIESLIARYARYPASKTVGDLSISYGDRIKSYRELLTRIRSGLSLDLAEPFAGGISISDKESRESNTDRVGPHFSRDMFKNNQDS